MFEVEVQADILRHPENPVLNKKEKKNCPHGDWSVARFNIFLTQRAESVLLGIYLDTKLIFKSFKVENGSLWTALNTKEIPVDIEDNLKKAYLDVKEDLLYVRRDFYSHKQMTPCCIVFDLQKVLEDGL